jgi:CHAD domain-containing protein
VSRIEKRPPTVVSSPDDKEELHLLREDVRRLRYILDLAEQKSVRDQLETLKVWQEVLGEIHDSDVFIRQMAQLKKPEEIGPMLEDEAFVRNRNYENFKSLAKTPLKLAS